ncbi:MULTISPECIES: hypothetical protein [Cupriavidus]
MQTNIRNIFTLGLMAAAAATLVACGGGSDSSSPSTPSSVTVNGKAVDFYLSGATVTFVDCNNQTTTTNATGDFTFPAGCTTSALKGSGGTDIGTGQPFTGVLQSPALPYKAGVTPVISPLSTLVAQLGASQAAALATKLGLGGKDLTTLDPMQDAAVLKAAVVVQQLVDQVTKTLTGLAKGGTLSAADAAAAAAKAVATAVNAASGTADLTSSTLVTSVVTAAVQNAKAGLPATLQANIDTVATNVGALAGPVVAGQVANVNASLGTIVLGASPAATLAALQAGGAVNAVTDSAKSTTTSDLVSAVTPATLADPSKTAGLSTLGDAVASGNPTAIQTAATGLGSGSTDSGAIGHVTDDIKPANFIQLASMTINGQTFPVSDAVTVTGGGSLGAVTVAVSKDGDPFAGAAADVRAGLSYTYNGSTVNVIIEKVSLTFSGSALTAVQVPANTAYSFSISGSTSANVSLTNAVADNLFSSVNGGSLSLPFSTFLAKLKSAGALSQAQIDALTPKATATFPVTFAVTGQGGKAVSVGTLTSSIAKKTGVQSVQTSTALVSGNGIKTAVTLNP